MAIRISDELVTLVRMLGEDDSLRAKFDAFAKLPPEVRAAALAQLVGCMKAGREDSHLIHAIANLKDSVLFDAVRRTLEEDER